MSLGELIKTTDVLQEVDPNLVRESDSVSLSEADWVLAKERFASLSPLFDLANVPKKKAREAGQQLGLDSRTVYRMIRRFRASGGLLSSLIRRPSSGGAGKGRLSNEVEAIISDSIKRLYLNRQKHKVEAVVTDVKRKCVEANLPIPGANTVRRRIAQISQREAVQKRQGHLAALKLTPNLGPFPVATRPLEWVMMDHTKVDLIVVDEFHREPLGRPWLTVAIDLFSRCICGFYLAFESPSSTSVGLCLAQVAMQKESFLERLGVQGTWPIFGKPENIFVDNGAEFYSEAFVRGCEQHGIKIHRRKKGFPNHSGIVERIIGTLMSEIHALPGTTFSNTQMRGNYDAEGKAILTLGELERWLTLVIIGKYHLDVHATLLEPPLVRYRKGLDEWQPQSIRVENHRSFFLDFLPLTRRSLQRHGFVVNHIFYSSNALSPWIASGKVNQNFTLRIDPRDLSRIFVLHPKETEYLEVPYRSLHRPTITAWEHRESIRKLKAKGVSTVDEASIFRTISEMRAIEEISENATKSARKRKENRLRNSQLTPKLKINNDENHSKRKADPELPFEVIEEW